MKPVHHLLSAVALAALSASTLASTTTYTSFGRVPGQCPAGFLHRGLHLFGHPRAEQSDCLLQWRLYTISAPGDLYANGFLGTNTEYDQLTIDFTSGNVTAVGANFYATIFGDAFFQAEMNIGLSDGTNVSFTPSSVNDSYRGFTSDIAITSLKLTVSNVSFNSLYAGLDNLRVGTTTRDNPIPEPTSVLLAGLGLAGLLVARRRTV
ncbi:MAG: PEP-CTERM sorting domain-containing protein [Ideonella sp.]|nr:PEP-CTERM sorting domain-containing protein [Ideonella sp.]